MNTHSERLQSDLDLVRLLAALVDDDEAAGVAGIIEHASVNLQRTRRDEGRYLRFDDCIEFSRQCAEQLGVPFDPPPRPPCAEAPAIEQDLAMLRGLLATAINSLNVSEVRRLITLIISAEKRLSRECKSCGLYLDRDAALAMGRALSDKMIAARGDMPNWNDRVDALLAKHPNLFPGVTP
jgi:hypothetical protein